MSWAKTIGQKDLLRYDAQPCAAANPAIALRLLTNAVVGRFAELGSLYCLDEMNVTLECGQGDLTIWFGSPTPSAQAIPVDGLPQCEVLIEHPRALCGFRFRSELARVCPYELAKLSANNSREQIIAALQSTYDSSSDMGYVYFDIRGPGSVKRSIDCGSVVVDIGDDGAVIGVEVFSPSDTFPVLTATDAE